MNLENIPKTIFVNTSQSKKGLAIVAKSKKKKPFEEKTQNVFHTKIL